eukprot:gene10487-19198_t
MVAEPVLREQQLSFLEENAARKPRNRSLTKVGIDTRRSQKLIRRSMSCDELAMCRNRGRSPIVKTVSPLFVEKSPSKSCLQSNFHQGSEETRKRTVKRKTRSSRCRSNTSMAWSHSKENADRSPLTGLTRNESTVCYCVENLNSNRKTSIKNLISFPTNSLLHSAVVEGDVELVQRLLLDDPTSVNKLGLEGTAPIHEAAINGDLQCLELLIRYGADLEVKDKCKRTALEYAVFAGNFDCAALLLRFGANDEKIRDGVPCM